MSDMDKKMILFSDPGDENQPTIDPIVRELVECLREASMLLLSFDYANAWRKQITRYRKALAAAEEAIREAPIETDGSGCYKGRANDWFDKPAVRRALGEIGGEE